MQHEQTELSRRYRGIQNTSGVSCHLSSSLQLLCCALNDETCGCIVQLYQHLLLLVGDTIRVALFLPNTEEAPSDEREEKVVLLRRACAVLIEFGRLVRSLESDTNDNNNNEDDTERNTDDKTREEDTITTQQHTIDPSPLYDALYPFVDPSRTGDAATSFATILCTIRQSMKVLSDSLTSNSTEIVTVTEPIPHNGTDNHRDCREALKTALLDATNQLSETFWCGTTLETVYATRTERITTNRSRSLPTPSTATNSSSSSTTTTTTNNNNNITKTNTSTNEIDTETIIRTTTRSKPSRQKPLPCPLPLPVKGYSNIIEAFESVVCHPQPIQGYIWGEEIQSGEHVETTSETMVNERFELSSNGEGSSSNSGSGSASVVSSSLVNDDSSTSSSSYCSTSSSTSSSTATSSLSHLSNTMSNQNDDGNDGGSDDDDGHDHWNTYKQTQIEHNRIPRALLFHLKRFEYHNGRVHKLSTNLDVPMEIRLSPYLHHQQQQQQQQNQQHLGTYSLRGAVVHTDPIERSRNMNRNRNRTEEGGNNDHCGHYIAYCAPRSKTDPTLILQQSENPNEPKPNNNNNNKINNKNNKNNKKNNNDDVKMEGERTQLWIKADDDRVTPFFVRSEDGIENNSKLNMTKPPNGDKDNVGHKRSSIVVVPKRSFLKVLSGGGGSIGGNRAAVLLLYTARYNVMD